MPSVVAFCLICFNALLHLIVVNFYFVLKSLTLLFKRIRGLRGAVGTI